MSVRAFMRQARFSVTQNRYRYKYGNVSSTYDIIVDSMFNHSVFEFFMQQDSLRLGHLVYKWVADAMVDKDGNQDYTFEWHYTHVVRYLFKHELSVTVREFVL